LKSLFKSREKSLGRCVFIPDSTWSRIKCMPELPEVETIVQVLGQKLEGLEIVSGKLLSPEICEKLGSLDIRCLEGRRITGIRRRGKIILMDCEGNISLLFHLGMTGQLLLYPPQHMKDRHTHFILAFRNYPLNLRFRDIRRFGFLSCVHTDKALRIKYLNKLGPEPLEISFSDFVSLFGKRKAKLKALLLNQQFIAGIGNIYADEILFRTKLHPSLCSSSLQKADLRRLWNVMRKVLKQALIHKGSSMRNYVDAHARPGKFQHYHLVYGKESKPCSVCGEKIERCRVSGRNSYFCPRCQPRSA
jgi:formamidopyrimidine-DNA glycosylase